jgi:hypothetical protein
MKQPIIYAVIPLFMGMPFLVHAAGVVGNGTAASCTEAALLAAVADGGEVTFNCGGEKTIKLTQHLELNTHTSIDGGGVITLDGQNKTRHILVRQGRYGGDKDNIISVSNITLMNGFSTGKGGAIHSSYWNTLLVKNVNFYNNKSTKDTEPCDGGGAIWLDAQNTGVIENSVFIGNHANNGGGINTVFSDVTIMDSYFENNKAIHTAAINKLNNCGGGGAIRFESAKNSKYGGTGLLKVLRTTVINNETNHAGGGLETYIYSVENVHVEDSFFFNNRSLKYGEGGAIAHGGPAAVTGRFHLKNSAVIGNLSEMQGGGLYFQAPAIVENVTLVGNKAINPNWKEEWQKGFGAGMALNGAQKSTFTNLTIAYNEAGALGGGVEGGEKSIFKNTIIAHNTAGSKWKIQINCIAPVIDGGNNLQIPTKKTKLNNDYDCFKGKPETEPLLGQWGFHGGITPTMPLLTGSPAINAGSACPTTDQRGIARQGNCDIGAYEFTSQAVTPAFDFQGQLSGGTGNATMSLVPKIDPRDSGKDGYLYVAALYQGKIYFFHDGGRALIPYESKQNAVVPVFRKDKLNNTAIPLFSQVNLTALSGIEIFAGYGLTQSDMVNNSKFKRIYPQ